MIHAMTNRRQLAGYTARRLRNALLMPSLHQTPYSGPVQPCTIQTSDGVSLAATLLTRQRDTVLIVCHGFAASQRYQGVVWLAETLLGPWDVLTFDWRGYGQSGGLSSFGGSEASDLWAVLAFARQRGYRRVGLIGESMGGMIALHSLSAALAAGHTPATMPFPDRLLTLGAPADYNLTGGYRPYLLRYLAPHAWARPIAPLLGFRLGPLSLARPLAVVQHMRLPLRMIHGTADNIVPAQNAYLLHERMPHADLRMYPGVGHAVTAMHVQCPARLVNDVLTHFEPLLEQE